MIRRSFDLPLLLRATTGVPGISTTPQEFEDWFNTPLNIMLTEGENVGLATYSRPGIYIIHWYYKVRGREAIDLGKKMLKHLIDHYDAKLIVGFVKTGLKASRWAARQVGMKSQGFVTFADGDENELFTTTKDDFLKGYECG